MIEQAPQTRDRGAYQHAQYLARKTGQKATAPPGAEPRPCPRCAAYAEEVAHLKRLLARRDEPPSKPGALMFPRTDHRFGMVAREPEDW